MHIECEKGSPSHTGSDRARARPARRGSSAMPDPRPARPHAEQAASLTLDRVLAAAARRRAPVSIETAGYIALAVADALATAPAVVLPAHVHLTQDGEVVLRGAARRGDEQAAEQSVRALLAELLSVAVGASPALTSAARRTTLHGLEALIEELEAGLIPVNRAAARRTMGRLAREVERSGVQVPEKRVAKPAATITKARRPEPARPRPPAPPPPLAEPESMDAQEEIPSVQLPDATDIDALVAVAVSPVIAPTSPPPPDTAPIDASAPCETADASEETDTPLLVLSDLASDALPVPWTTSPEPEPSDGWEPEVDEDDLLTYEPPAAAGDESLDFGTASPPLAEPIAEAVAEPIAGAVAEPIAEEVSESSAEPVVAESVTVEPRRARRLPASPDRVNELLADFGSPERSSRELAGELKSMLGLPPTPAPPQAQAGGCREEGGSSETEAPSNSEAPPVPLAIQPPRHPRLGLAITTGLLLLAVAGMIALYALYPALLFGR
jgi:hypothetical protein